MRGGWHTAPDAPRIEMFFRLLAVCHTVIPDGEQVRVCLWVWVRAWTWVQA